MTDGKTPGEALTLREPPYYWILLGLIPSTAATDDITHITISYNKTYSLIST